MSIGSVIKEMTINISTNPELAIAGFATLGGALAALKVGADAVSSSARLMGDALIRGGDYNETATAFEKLAQTHLINGPKVIDILSNIVGGTKDVKELTEIASDAIKRGYSVEQIETIATFAKRVSEATGKSFEGTMQTIEGALLGGRLNVLQKEFGLVVEKGESMASVMEKIRAKTDEMGTGAYNLGDDLTSMGKGLDSVLMSIGRFGNLMLEEAGLGGFFAWIRKEFQIMVNNSAILAEAMFRPFISIAEALMPVVEGLFGALGYDFISFGALAKDTLRVVGNLAFTMVEAFAGVWNSTMGLVTQGAQKWLGMWEYLGTIKIRGHQLLDDEALSRIQGMEKSLGQVWINVEGIDAKQKEYNETLGSMVISGGSLDKATIGHDAWASAIKAGNIAVADTVGKVSTLGQELSATGTKAKKAAEEMQPFFGFNTVSVTVDGKKYLNPDYAGASANTSASSVAKYLSQFPDAPKTGGAKVPIEPPATSGRPIKIEVSGKDGAMKELIEEIIERVTTQAVAEGLITAGV